MPKKIDIYIDADMLDTFWAKDLQDLNEWEVKECDGCHELCRPAMFKGYRIRVGNTLLITRAQKEKCEWNGKYYCQACATLKEL